MSARSGSMLRRISIKPALLSKRAHSTRIYADAIEALNTLQSNAASIEALRKQGASVNKHSVPEMLDWLRRLGYQPEDFEPLNAIHIAGTKGKGSTAAFVASILNQYRTPVRNGIVNKVGLYTSPHLRFVRERIQINGQPLSEEAFTKSFFEVWDRLEQSQSEDPIPQDSPQKLIYFRYLTIMALHTFVKENVNAAVIECGIGGEFDSTNVLSSPAVAGITSLGIDHIALLGSTIDSIAWHKAGILKPGVPAFTSPQPKEALEVLFSRAKDRGTSLTVVNTHPQIASGEAELGLNGDFQKVNASLAVELAARYLRSQGMNDLTTKSLPKEFLYGLKDVHWGGRCEIRQESDLTWLIDGAHTMESIQVTAQWYSSLRRKSAEKSTLEQPRILLFNQQTRAGIPLLEELHQIIKNNTDDEPAFTHAIFCSNLTYNSSGYRPDLISINVDKDVVQDLRVQREFAEGWKSLTNEASRSQVLVVSTIEDAVKECRNICKDWRQSNAVTDKKPSVLVTGSIHLIGGLLDVIEDYPSPE